MRRLLTLGLALFTAVFTLAVLPPAALAVQYSLTADKCTGTCGGGPYGTIDVTQIGPVGDGVVQVTVTLAAGVKFVKTGFDGSFGFNLDGISTIGSISGLTPGFSLLSLTAGSSKYDGFGKFEYSIVCDACGSGGSNPQPGPLTFTLSATGLTEASFAELSTGRGGTHAYFVADILGTNGKTGPVGAVPEPGTLVLAGTALVGLGAWARRRMRGSRPIA
jgi:hypothetical protein